MLYVYSKAYFIFAVFLSIALMVGSSSAAQELVVHRFNVTENLEGFSAGRASLAYQTDIIREGGQTGNLEVKINADSTWANIVIRDRSLNNPHPNWLTDWTSYGKISGWFFFDELETIPDHKGVTVRIGGSRDSQIIILKSELQIGWNYIEVDLLSIMGDQADNLANMDSTMLELIVDKEGIFLIDEIQLIKTVD